MVTVTMVTVTLVIVTLVTVTMVIVTMVTVTLVTVTIVTVTLVIVTLVTVTYFRLLLSHASRKSAYIIRSLLPRNVFHLRLSLWHETKIVFDTKGTWNTVTNTVTNTKNYKYLLEQWKKVSELFIFCKIAPDFEYRAVAEFEIDDFHVDDGHWVYLEDFFNCRKFSLFNQSRRRDFRCAKPEVIKEFIRKWIESNYRLEYLEIFSDPVEMNFEGILSGLEYRPVESKVSHYQIVEIARRCDGKKATVKRGEYSLELKIIE
ncbi:hypothetical protein CRE_04237 [Caenorhabditis remanei]|uniref:F-box associated domain-containing protein n=1 Tax=Caenorhabditis remanei TaxID=31234 RepID=E3MYW5_CAERE|nr:hypothetical protein CRE_04237 [Caenorhabditis remanei]